MSKEHVLLREIREQPKAILDSLEQEKLEIERTSNLLIHRRIRFLGMGSSYFASIYAKYLLQDLGLIDAEAWPASEFIHYPSPVHQRDILVIVSQSGESIETVKAVRSLKKRCFILGVTNNPKSTLAKLSSHLLLTHAGVEKASATKTFVATLALLDQLALEVSKRAGRISERRKTQSTLRLFNCALRIEKELPEWEQAAKHWSNLLASRRASVIIARGYNLAAALQGALLMKEVVKTPAEAMTAGEFMHGPLEIVSKDLLPIVLSSGRTKMLMQQLTRRITEINGKVLTLSNEEDPDSIRFDERDETLTIFPSTVILELLTYFAAIQKGLNPDHFNFISKVTRAE